MNNMWPEVKYFNDGENVDAQTLNKPVSQLASRTDYLKNKVDQIGEKSSVILTGVTLAQDEAYAPKLGQAVFYYADEDHHEFRKAQATMDLMDDYKAADSAFTVGILVSGGNGSGSVLVYGKTSLDGFNKSDILQSGEEFRSGRYYLSATEPGKITANPSGPLIYVGTFQSNGDDSKDFTGASLAIINPQFLDIGTSHVHRAYPLVARPAGVLDGTEVIGYLPAGSESPTTLSSDPAGSSSSEGRAPSIVFGGTWTSTNDTTYRFSLNGNTWGGVELHWDRDGAYGGFVDIPAPNVFVDIDNGLKAKLIFPKADSEKAYPCDTTYVWDSLVFPYAGKGWVNHSVTVRAETDGSRVKAEISGAWTNGESATVMFPKEAYSRIFAERPTEGDSIAVGETEYTFKNDPQAETDVQIAGTVEETLGNLAKKVNGDGTPNLFYRDGLLVSCGKEITDGEQVHSTVTDDRFDLVGGVIPILLAYGEGFRLWGAPELDVPCYRTTSIGALDITVFAPDATATANNVHVLFADDLRLTATAADPRPDAAYDYVMGLHQEVDYYFPPVPDKSAGLFVNGVEMENAALFPKNPTYAIGPKTIHWMEDDEEHLPWPKGIVSHDDIVDPKDDKTMAFYFNVGFQCANGPVTSLVPAPGSNVKIYTHGTNDTAYTGDLMIDVACDFEVADRGLPGYIVPKQGRNGKLLAGAVVERLKAGPGISISQARGCPAGQGTVTIALDNSGLSGQFSEIALENAKQEKIGLFPYVSLLGWNTAGTNIPSAFTAMMRVPANLDPSVDYRLQVKAVVFGVSSFTSNKRQAAGLEFEYNILPDYTGSAHRSLKTGLLIPDSSRKIAVPFGHSDTSGQWTYTAFDPFVLHTDDGTESIPDVSVTSLKGPIPQASEFTTIIPVLKPGYLVAMRFARTSNPDPVGFDPYVGAIGFMSLEWNLEEA